MTANPHADNQKGGRSMASVHEIDPRLRDSSTNTFPQHKTSTATPLRPDVQSQRYAPFQEASPHQNVYQPQTPHSIEYTGDQDGEGGTHEGGNSDPKRPRACEACRGLKVRCDPDPNNPEGACKRCAKAKRNCVITVPSRKRQKKTDSRVAELEKKIDALTASLQASKSGSGTAPPGIGNDRDSLHQQFSNNGYNSPFTGRLVDGMGPNEWATHPNSRKADPSRASVVPAIMAGQKRKHTEIRDYITASDSPISTSIATEKSVETANLQHQPEPRESLYELQRQRHANTSADVIEKGLISLDTATRLFDIYVERMAPHLPAVVFPSGTSAAEIRESKPTLFLAVICASSGTTNPSLQLLLTKEIMRIYAERIICNGEKSLELIQALHLSTIWYCPPEHFEELKFYQLIHIAAVMALDIGLGKKVKTEKGKSTVMWRDELWRRILHPNPENIEARRAWLTCYLLCCNASMGLRRPNLIRWSAFMGECVEVLETSPEALQSDKLFCQWVRSQHIAEDIGTQFSMDDPVAIVSIADPKVQYALKGFERDLEKWSAQVPPAVRNPSLEMTEHVINLYMHEVAMHVDHTMESLKAPYSGGSLRGLEEELTPTHINALSTCLTSIDGIFETFLKFDAETIRCMPIFQFVRVAYAVVVLIKMYFAAATLNSELGRVINKDNMKVEQYLEGLVEIFKASAAEEKSRPSAKFLLVLELLKQWFTRQREGKAPQANNSAANPGDQTTIKPEPTAEKASDANRVPLRQLTQRRQSAYGPANTPLQLLSEVATGNSGRPTMNEGASGYPSSTKDWPQQRQQQSQQSYPQYDIVNEAQQNIQQGYNNIDPALSMDPGYTMGIGFEQAMGMTLGGGDFGTYFGDDAFLANLMDPANATSQGFDGF